MSLRSFEKDDSFLRLKVLERTIKN